MSIMKNIILSISLISFFTFSCNSSQKIDKPLQKDGINFVKSETLQAVLERAEKENKLVFLDMYTDWCMPCKLMDEDVYPDKKLGKFMNKNFISYKSNAEKGTGVTLAAVFNVKYYPTLLFLDAKGHELERNEGAIFHRDLEQMANRALATQDL